MIIQDESLQIRPITEIDFEDVLNVYRGCEDFLALGPEPHASTAMVLKDIETSRREGGLFCLVYGQGGSIIGVVDYIPKGYDEDTQLAYLSLLVIVPPFRGLGLGTRIVQMIETEMEKNPDVTKILTSVQVNNPRGLQFWRKCGYRIVGGPESRPDQTTVFHFQKDLRSNDR